MAEHTPAGPVETGAPMDYVAHERTYTGFLTLLKVTILATVATLFALILFAFGSGGGFWLGTILILLMLIAAAIGIFSGGSLKPLVAVTILGALFVIMSVG
jgi:hypothetical protein